MPWLEIFVGFSKVFIKNRKALSAKGQVFLGVCSVFLKIGGGEVPFHLPAKELFQEFGFGDTALSLEPPGFNLDLTIIFDFHNDFLHA